MGAHNRMIQSHITFQDLVEKGHTLRLLSEEECISFSISTVWCKRAKAQYYQCSACAALIYVMLDGCFLSSHSSTYLWEEQELLSCDEIVVRDIIQ